MKKLILTMGITLYQLSGARKTEQYSPRQDKITLIQFKHLRLE
ncbi:hypothetical protein [Cysteiniphilum halobium]|nr:hypothetical protein [Cysteiniphilum halobium]